MAISVLSMADQVLSSDDKWQYYTLQVLLQFDN